MNSLYKKVILTGMVVLVAFVITIGSTFAWFTIGQAADIQNMNLSINSSESILIQMDNNYNMDDNFVQLTTPTNYKSVLTNDDIDDFYDFLNGNIIMKPLTSTNGISITRQNGSTALFATKNELDEVPAGEYIQFSVWLLSQSASANIAISNLTLSASNTLVEKNIVINAVRLSIDAGAANEGTKRIFGLGKDYGFVFGVNDVGYDPTPDTTNNAILPAVASSLISTYHAVFHTDGTATPGESVSDKAVATHVFNLAANTPTKVTIRIWIEGWDSQANNNLIGAVFNIAFSFIAKPQA
jgi:hypothetical protein